MSKKNTRRSSRRRKTRKSLRRKSLQQRGGAGTRYIISSHGRAIPLISPQGHFIRQAITAIPEGIDLYFFVNHGECFTIPNQVQTQTCTSEQPPKTIELIRHPGISYNYMLSKDSNKEFLSGAVDCSTGEVIFTLETYRDGNEVELQLVLKKIKEHNDEKHPGTTAEVYCLFCRNP